MITQFAEFVSDWFQSDSCDLLHCIILQSDGWN